MRRISLITLIGLILSLANTGLAQIKWEETFDTPNRPEDWTTIDNDGSGNSWGYLPELLIGPPGGPYETVSPHAGIRLWHGEWLDANDSGLIDEWLISPQLPTIGVGDSLSFWAGANGGQWDDSLRVLVSTTNDNIGSFVHEIGYFRVDGPVGSWHKYSFDMTEFAGWDVYIAVNYYIVDGGANGANSENVWVDHFILTAGPNAIEDNEAVISERFQLFGNYPNPFNPATTILFTLPQASLVDLKVFTITGQEIRTVLDNQPHIAGLHSVRFDADGMANGTYFYRLKAGDQTATKTFTLLK